MAQEKRNYNADQLIPLLDENLYETIHGRRNFCIPLEKGGHFLNFHYCNIESLARKDVQVCFYCDEEQLIMISENRHCREILESIPQTLPPYLQLLTFFNQLLTNDINVLEDLEDRITLQEDSLLENNKIKRTSVGKIVTMRRQLLRMKRYYEQLQFMIDNLAENENQMLSPLLERRYITLSHRIKQLTKLVQNLRELVNQVREAYQAQIDIEQNKLMKIFTVITTIFMPLTVIVGWYGMNFDTMPELHWQYGYLYVILLSFAVCLGCGILFYKKNWFK